MNPVFLMLCLIMFGVFYQKGLKFFLNLGHGKWRSHIEGALLGFLVGFAFPLGVILLGAQRKPDGPPSVTSAPQVSGPAQAGGAKQDAAIVPQ